MVFRVSILALLFSLLATPSFNWAAIAPQSCPAQESSLQVGAESAETEPEAHELAKRISTLIAESMEQNPTLQPVVHFFSATKATMTHWLGKNHKPISLAVNLTRACGGGIVTYLGLSMMGSTDLLTNLVISSLPAAVSYFWMKNNSLLQSIIAFSPARKIGDWFKTRFLKKESKLGHNNLLVNTLDRVYEILASMGVEITFEGPKQVAAHLLMKAGQFKGSFIPIVGLLTLGQGLTEISLAHKTKADLKTARSEEEKAGKQLLSDLVVLSVSTLSVFATALEYMDPSSGNWILIPLAVSGVSYWLDTFVSQYVTKFFSSSKCQASLAQPYTLLPQVSEE